MAWALGSIVAALGMLLSCAGTLADPPALTDEAGSDATAAQALTPRHDRAGAAVIATLRTRDIELTILSEGGSMRYSLLDSAGVSKSLSLDQLRAYDRNLFEFVKAAMARAAAHPAADFVDARVEPAAGSRGASVPVLPVRQDRNGSPEPRLRGVPID